LEKVIGVVMDLVVQEQNKIDFYKKEFRILHDWSVAYLPSDEHYAKCTYSLDDKIAGIYPYYDNKVSPDVYIIHELLHICIAALRETGNDKESEEQFVQDLCRVIKL
jgi:hypothetical protein